MKRLYHRRQCVPHILREARHAATHQREQVASDRPRLARRARPHGRVGASRSGQPRPYTLLARRDELRPAPAGLRRRTAAGQSSLGHVIFPEASATGPRPCRSRARASKRERAIMLSVSWPPDATSGHLRHVLSSRPVPEALRVGVHPLRATPAGAEYGAHSLNQARALARALATGPASTACRHAHGCKFIRERWSFQVDGYEEVSA